MIAICYVIEQNN